MHCSNINSKEICIKQFSLTQMIWHNSCLQYQARFLEHMSYLILLLLNPKKLFLILVKVRRSQSKYMFRNIICPRRAFLESRYYSKFYFLVPFCLFGEETEKVPIQGIKNTDVMTS